MRLETFFTVSEHAELFFLSVVLGVGMGVLYDCFRVLRIVFPPAKKEGFVVISDIIFWLCFGFAVFVFSVEFGRGHVRIFYFAGSILGFILYILSIGSLITGVIRKAAAFMSRVLRKIYSLTIEPVVKILRSFRQKTISVFVRNHKDKKKEEKSRLIHLKFNRLMMYNYKRGNTVSHNQKFKKTRITKGRLKNERSGLQGKKKKKRQVQV